MRMVLVGHVGNDSRLPETGIQAGWIQVIAICAWYLENVNNFMYISISNSDLECCDPSVITHHVRLIIIIDILTKGNRNRNGNTSQPGCCSPNRWA